MSNRSDLAASIASIDRIDVELYAVHRRLAHPAAEIRVAHARELLKEATRLIEQARDDADPVIDAATGRFAYYAGFRPGAPR